MSHERGSTGPQGASVPGPEATSNGVVARLKRHLQTWPRRYVEMRTGRVAETAPERGGGGTAD